MKYIYAVISVAVFLLVIISYQSVIAQEDDGKGYILEHERDLGIQQPGPHDGGGITTGFNYFSKAEDMDFVFRKRVLHPGSSIGYHLQEADEIYYIVAGTGEMKMNDKIFDVGPGDGILTRPGSSHSLKPKGNDDLELIIVYER